MERRNTRQIQVGDVKIGGNNPVAIQSMANTDTRDATATVEQIKKLQEAGCEIIRVAVPDMAAAKAVKDIKSQISIPLVADIHFDHKLALESIKSGADKIRINPGNIGNKEKVKEVVEACKNKGLPIRIGVNIGSLEKDIEKKYGRTAKGMVESALFHIKILEDLDFYDIAISLKASDVLRTVGAYRLLSQEVDYPLHLGITEAGTPKTGIIKSSVGIGIMLAEGIGDTLRISLTSDPVEEIRVAWEILKSLNLRQRGASLISCPTCGRTEIDLIGLANEVEKIVDNINKPITVAVMGCVVNGPGEAKEADIGVAGGKGSGVIFKKGKVLKSVPENMLLQELTNEINNLIRDDI
jgi:(E)-4-hydroxy-3-methylbut-2-enyl-diphosphate synthase